MTLETFCRIVLLFSLPFVLLVIAAAALWFIERLDK